MTIQVRRIRHAFSRGVTSIKNSILRSNCCGVSRTRSDNQSANQQDRDSDHSVNHSVNHSASGSIGSAGADARELSSASSRQASITLALPPR